MSPPAKRGERDLSAPFPALPHATLCALLSTVAGGRGWSSGIVAPAVTSDGERLLIMPSMTTQGTIYSTEDPASGKIDYFVRRMPPLPDHQPSCGSPTVAKDWSRVKPLPYTR